MKKVKKIRISELSSMAESMYGNLVKADVDIEKDILLVDMSLHADGEAYLLESGSKQEDLWGINLHPDKYGTNEFIEFDSMINIKPRQANYNRSISDPVIVSKITKIVGSKVYED